MAVPFVQILPHFFLLYAVLFALTGRHIIAVAIVVFLALALYVFKLPQSPQADSDMVLQTSVTPIIAHRGAVDDAPENTLAAINLAKKNGAHAIEFDVGFTSDGIAVVIHDSSVDRTTDGTGKVKLMTFDKVRKLNASARHPKRDIFPNEQIPTLDEVVKLCLELDLNMYIDVKDDASLTADTMGKLFEKYPDLYKKALVCSFHPQIIYMVKRQDPGIVTGLTHSHHVLSRDFSDAPVWLKPLVPVADIVLEWSYYAWLWYLCGNNVALIDRRDISQTTVDHFRDRNISVVLWTVNDPVEKTFLTEVLKCPFITDTLQNSTTN